MTTRYDKLVRDKVPKIMSEKGEKAIIRYLAPGEEYKKYLLKKHEEEVNEYLANPSTEEAADIMTVLLALFKSDGLAIEDVVFAYNKKLETWGGFEDRICLIEKIT